MSQSQGPQDSALSIESLNLVLSQALSNLTAERLKTGGLGREAGVSQDIKVASSEIAKNPSSNNIAAVLDRLGPHEVVGVIKKGLQSENLVSPQAQQVFAKYKDFLNSAVADDQKTINKLIQDLISAGAIQEAQLFYNLMLLGNNINAHADVNKMNSQAVSIGFLAPNFTNLIFGAPKTQGDLITYRGRQNKVELAVDQDLKKYKESFAVAFPNIAHMPTMIQTLSQGEPSLFQKGINAVKHFFTKTLANLFGKKSKPSSTTSTLPPVIPLGDQSGQQNVGNAQAEQAKRDLADLAKVTPKFGEDSNKRPVSSSVAPEAQRAQKRADIMKGLDPAVGNVNQGKVAQPASAESDTQPKSSNPLSAAPEAPPKVPTRMEGLKQKFEGAKALTPFDNQQKDELKKELGELKDKGIVAEKRQIFNDKDPKPK